MEKMLHGSLKDMQDVANLCASSCLNCTMSYPGFFPSCPMLNRYSFMTYSSKGMSGLIQAYLAGVVEMNHDLARVMFSCALCGACRVGCQQDWKDYNLEAFEAMREEIVEAGMAPPEVRDFFKSITSSGNPFGGAQNERGAWADGLGIPQFTDQEYLFYVGDVGSYDVKGMRSAKAVASILTKAGVSFGILGTEELSDGNEVNRLGERGLFEYLAQENLEKLRALGVKKIVTLSPHAYNTFKRDYPSLGGDFFEVEHYTQVLARAVGESSLEYSGLSNKRVVYHDPCFLGRRNEEYEAPRALLQSIPGLVVLPLAQEREIAFCCGGGGGNFATDFLGGGGAKDPNRHRIRQLAETGADIVAVACPTCALMLEDALKAEGLDDGLAVRDIAELMDEAC